MNKIDTEQKGSPSLCAQVCATFSDSQQGRKYTHNVGYGESQYMH